MTGPAPHLDEATIIEIADDLIDQARNYGGPLLPPVRKRLLELITRPSPATWEDAHGILLNASKGMASTLWRQMVEVDPTCPRRSLGDPQTTPPAFRWNGYVPHTYTVLLAIRTAVAPLPEQPAPRNV